MLAYFFFVFRIFDVLDRLVCIYAFVYPFAWYIAEHTSFIWRASLLFWCVRFFFFITVIKWSPGGKKVSEEIKSRGDFGPRGAVYFPQGVSSYEPTL
jgi:hypothetical protein